MRVFLFASLLLWVCASAASDLTPEELHRSEPLYKKGRLFEIKIVPSAKSLQVFLVGHKVHSYAPDEIKVKAYVVSRETKSDLDVKKQNGSFVIARPDSPANMKINVRHLLDEEEFELNPPVEDRGAHK